MSDAEIKMGVECKQNLNKNNRIQQTLSTIWNMRQTHKHEKNIFENGRLLNKFPQIALVQSKGFLFVSFETCIQNWINRKKISHQKEMKLTTRPKKINEDTASQKQLKTNHSSTIYNSRKRYLDLFKERVIPKFISLSCAWNLKNFVN